jgi:CDP-diacylglycerol--glycerol-3-phosphate 3-phosphatidyltransferase
LQDRKQTCHYLKERFWNIPNTLSLYRLIAFPFILWLIITGRKDLFAVFIAISLVTDLLDGIIARVFNMQTQIGARLDSWADTGTFICSFLAIWFFKWEFIKPHEWMWWFFFSAWTLSYIVVFAKFRGLIGLHTYLFKITGYVQGAFIICLFLFNFYAWLFYVALGIGTLACLEEIAIILIIKKPVINVKGLYWVLKNNKR